MNERSQTKTPPIAKCVSSLKLGLIQGREFNFLEELVPNFLKGVIQIFSQSVLRRYGCRFFTLWNINTDESRASDSGTQCTVLCVLFDKGQARLRARFTTDVFYVMLVIVKGMQGHGGRALFSKLGDSSITACFFTFQLKQRAGCPPSSRLLLPPQ